MIRTSNLPEELRRRGHFCLWRYEERNGQRTKVPYNPRNPQERGRSNEPSTFAPLEVAEAALSRCGYDGLGIGIFEDFAGIDIDHCVDDAGRLSEMAEDIVRTMDTYTEVSPSGHGLRILFLAPGFQYDKAKYYIKLSEIGLECYIAGMTNRYLTVTGDTIRYAPLAERTKELQAVLDKYMVRNPQDGEEARKPTQTAGSWSYGQKVKPGELTDNELIWKAKNARNGDTFSRLWTGDTSGYASHSEADQALCNLLAFWTNKDAGRMDALFRESGLMREKWDRRQSGTTYGAITIAEAIRRCGEGYEPPQRGLGSPQTAGTPSMGQSTTKGTGSPQTPPDAPQRGQGDPGQDAQPAPVEFSGVAFLDTFMDKVQTDIYRPLKTGMGAFDRLLGGGILRQSLVILSAAPGTGKTTLAQQIFEEMAKGGADVLYLNLEMSAEQLLARSLSRIAYRNGRGMSAADVLKGYAWIQAQREAVEDAVGYYKEIIAPHFVYNPQGMGHSYQSIGAMLTRYGEAARDRGTRAPVVVLDYLHLLSSDGREDAQEIVKNAVKMLKDYAVEYDTFVFALSATNRTSNMQGKISMQSSRDSSGIEYTADYMLSLNYQALAEKEKIPGTDVKYNADDPNHMEMLQQQNPRKMLVQVIKNRMNAAGGKLPLDFDAAHSVFIPQEKTYSWPKFKKEDDYL